MDACEKQNGRNQDDAQLIKKLKNDKIKLKGHLKLTRNNNGVLRNMVDKLKTEKQEIEGLLRDSNEKLASSTNEIEVLKRNNEELRKKNQESEIKAKELEGTIEQFKIKESKAIAFFS